MDCRVVLEAAVPVYDVGTTDEAVRVAVAKTGEMINPDLNYVEIEVGERTSPSGEALDPAFVAAETALVALTLEMDVFNVDREKHASRIAHTEIGDRLEDIPLEVLDVHVLDETADENETGERDDTRAETERAETDDAPDDVDDAGDEERTATERGDESEAAVADASSERSESKNDADVLPSFEELLEE